MTRCAFHGPPRGNHRIALFYHGVAELLDCGGYVTGIAEHDDNGKEAVFNLKTQVS